MTEERTEYQVNTHGGKRSGAGPKPRSKDGRKRGMISLRFSPDITDWYASLPKGKRTEMIEAAIREKYGV